MNRIIIDWLSFSVKFETITGNKIFERIVDMIGFKDTKWELLNGMYGYRDRFYYEGISIHVNNATFDSAWIEMSGQGCRTFEEFSTTEWDDLICLIVSDLDIKVNRLDIAYDDFSGVLDINQLCEATIAEHFTSRWRKYEVIISNGGNSVIHGSRKSDMLLRIYDKAAEQKIKDFHWIRAELQMRDDNANGFLKSLYLKDFGLGTIFSGCLINYLRYVEPSDDSHMHRWKTTEYWDLFIGDAEKIRILETPGVEYTMDDLEHYVLKMAGNAVKTYVDIMGTDKLIEELKRREYRDNKKYNMLKDDQRHLQSVYSGQESPKFIGCDN